MRDHSEGRLERFALLATPPTRAEEDVNRVAPVRESFHSVLLAHDPPPDGASASVHYGRTDTFYPELTEPSRRPATGRVALLRPDERLRVEGGESATARSAA